MLRINNTDLPTPQSVTYSYNKLWSENTGRLDSGYFVGDLIGIKNKYEVTFPPLTTAEYSKVQNAFNTEFAMVTITNAEGHADVLECYFGDFTVESYSWRDGIKYAINARISIIER